MAARTQKVGLFEAKTHLSALIERVERGDEITITRHGVPVARLVPPVADRSRKNLHQVVEEIFALRKGVKLRGVTIRELREEGRRY
ncbi:MAG: type II toxin-antitoxin system Phd/YefM family antitoxin [Candidatus Binataceae bacterium]